MAREDSDFADMIYLVEQGVDLAGEMSDADLRQHRIIPGTYLTCRMFRHIVQKYSAIHKVLPAFFEQSDENSDGAIYAPELCGVALKKLIQKQYDNVADGVYYVIRPVAQSCAAGFFCAPTPADLTVTIAPAVQAIGSVRVNSVRPS